MESFTFIAYEAINENGLKIINKTACFNILQWQTLLEATEYEEIVLRVTLIK